MKVFNVPYLNVRQLKDTGYTEYGSYKAPESAADVRQPGRPSCLYARLTHV